MQNGCKAGRANQRRWLPLIALGGMKGFDPKREIASRLAIAGDLPTPRRRRSRPRLFGTNRAQGANWPDVSGRFRSME